MSESVTYQTVDGDTLDRICHAYYGRTSGAVEAVMEANPGLADRGPVFDAGVKIVLPDLPEPAAANTVRLWD